jgi:hypothetical protein
VIPQESPLTATKSVGQIISYWCSTCDGYTTAIVVDDGIPPARVACRARGIENCDGAAYPEDRRHDDVVPKWELFNPVADRSVTSDENAAVRTAITALILRRRAA